MRIGIDTGGTFTDFVIAGADGTVRSFKLRSNAADPASVILDGLSRITGDAEVVHGSTVATNALLERNGARTALVTTAGFEDVIEIGRQNRDRLYDLCPPAKRQLSDPSLRFGVRERTHFNGDIEAAPAPAELDRLARALRRNGAESVAICCLHSYANPSNEQAIAAALQGAGYVCASHEISPEFREYERTTTTFLNAYVGPLMDRYIGRLDSVRRLWIMQSNGGLIRASEAREHAVRTLLSGPVGGVIGALRMAQLSGYTRVLGFDMGGTSTDVSLSDGEPRLTTEGYVDGLPVRVPMLDIQTVGAGGGSIARVDEGGLLRVGPESAGADPGPACYGKGTLPTVTDAHVVLGRVKSLLGGEMPLDTERAERAVDGIAQRLGVSRKAAARAIIDVANATMQRAIRSVSVQRGYDPRRFALVAFGGCGGLHACEIAADLGITTVVAPERAGVLSALGMLLADRVRDYSAGRWPDGIEKAFRTLERTARKDLPKAILGRSADQRYTGQSYELNVPWGSDFHAAHQREYGYADPSRTVETITLRVRATDPVPPLTIRPAERRKMKKPVNGPALFAEYGSTVWTPRGWSYTIDEFGNLIISR